MARCRDLLGLGSNGRIAPRPEELSSETEVPFTKTEEAFAETEVPYTETEEAFSETEAPYTETEEAFSKTLRPDAAPRFLS